MALLIKKDTCLIILRTKHQVAPQPSLSNANHKDKGKAWAFGLEKEKNKNHFWGKYSPTFNFANYVTHKWFYRVSIFHFWNVLFVRYKSSMHWFFISFTITFCLLRSSTYCKFQFLKNILLSGVCQISSHCTFGCMRITLVETTVYLTKRLLITLHIFRFKRRLKAHPSCLWDFFRSFHTSMSAQCFLLPLYPSQPRQHREVS